MRLWKVSKSCFAVAADHIYVPLITSSSNTLELDVTLFNHHNHTRVLSPERTHRFLLHPSPTGGPIKSLLSVYLSFCMPVHSSVQYFHQKFMNGSLVFFCFCFSQWYIIGIFKNWHPFIPGKFIFTQIWTKRHKIAPK